MTMMMTMMMMLMAMGRKSVVFDDENVERSVRCR